LEEDSFITASFFNKVMILLGGILANIIIAYLIFVTVFLIGTKPLIIIPENAIQESTKSYIMPDTQFAIEKDILDVEIVS
jgi:membrane-associated protease RseP (regulator of RpoE activity)